MRSIKGRLSFALSVSLIFVFIVQWALVSFAIQRVTENHIATRLEHDAENILPALSLTQGQIGGLNAARLGIIYQQPLSGHYYLIQAGDTLFRSRSLWDEDLPVVIDGEVASQRLRVDGPRGQRLLVVLRTYRKQNLPITIAIAEDLTPVEGDVVRYQLGYALVSAVALLLLVWIQQRSVRRSLRPLDEARVNLARLAQGETAMLSEAVPVEVQPLVHEINRLVKLLGERTRRSRNALGNLAHALKSPLTVLSQGIRECGTGQSQNDALELDAQVEHIRNLMVRELRRARLAGEPAPGTRFRLDKELPDLLSALRHIYSAKSLDLGYAGPPRLVVTVDREDMLELAGNLLDNACKWAQHRVKISVHQNSAFSFVVEDDGPGAPPDTLERLTRRGIRLDETTQGHGLGLSIVREIVDQYGGSLSFGRSETLGGFRAEVKLAIASHSGEIAAAEQAGTYR
jgi:signal transduction histidine kinase